MFAMLPVDVECIINEKQLDIIAPFSLLLTFKVIKVEDHISPLMMLTVNISIK